MSPRRQPWTLFQHCLNHFSKLFDTLCKVHRKSLSHPDIESALKYASALPVAIQAAIGDTIVMRYSLLLNSLLQTHIKILLELKVRHLYLSGSVVQSEVVENEDASHLERLVLSYGCGDRAAKLYSFLQTATNLTHLECTDFCNDTMMGIIASCCHNLYCLDLRCCEVTNEGVLRLCGFQQNLRQCFTVISSGSRLVPNSRCSQTLREIKFTMTKVTEAGVAIILLVLTNIYLLRVPDITMAKLFTFLKTLDHTNVQCKLKEFHSREILDEDQLTVLTRLCPNLEYMQMSFVGNIDMDHIRLNKLTRLRMLSGVKFADVNTDALMEFLTEMGSQLQHLFLYTYRTKLNQEKLKITHTHLWNLARCCPNLRNLTLDGYSLDDDTLPITIDRNGMQFFHNLHTLKLFSMRLSDEDLKIFLYKCTRMKTLELALKDPHVLHDKLVSELLDKGVWKNLTQMRILHSPITIKVMLRLVKECPNLQNLGSLYTWLVAKDQVTDFKKMVRRENLDIELY